MDKFRKQDPAAYRYDEGAAVSIVRTPAGPAIWQMAQNAFICGVN